MLKFRHCWSYQTIKIAALVFVLFSTIKTNSLAQYISEKPLEDQQFLKIKEIFKLVEKAKKAGFSDEEINNLTISYGYKKILLKDVIKAYETKATNQSNKILDFSDSTEQLSLLDALLDQNKKTTDKTNTLKLFSSQDVRAQLNSSQKNLLNGLLEASQKK